MLERIAKWVCALIFLPHIREVERKVGHKLVFRNIPNRFIDGVVSWDMTSLWKRAGLNIQAGANYWTIGNVRNGISSRYDRNSTEYQTWLGGYTVRLTPGSSWTPEDHTKLGVADQNSWLNTYGDPNPFTSFLEWGFTPLGQIKNGKYSGTLYEAGCTTHSDVGKGRRSLRGCLSPFVQAALMNLWNKNLRIKGGMMTLRQKENQYEPLRLRGYFAIFDLGDDTHVILYGNGTIVPKKEGDFDTLPIIEEDLLKAMKSCEIADV